MYIAQILQVFVDEELCGTIEVRSDVLVYPVACGRIGSSVKIQVSNQYLTLCEVEVIGESLNWHYSLLTLH